jgi:hypothetical protein
MAYCGKLTPVQGDKIMKARKTELVPAPKRPAANPPMPEPSIEKLAEYFAGIKGILENYAVHLRPLDRRRLNGVGIPTRGFITQAYQFAEENPELLPYYIPLEKFSEDYENFINFHNVLDQCKQAQKMLWNITLQAADTAYADALKLYASAREAADSGMEASINVYKDLFPFFKKSGKTGGAPARKEVLSDVNALLSGKRSGEVTVRNVKPKVIKGGREVIDEEFTTNHTNGHELKN